MLKAFFRNKLNYSYKVTDSNGKPILKDAIKNLNLSIKKGEFLVLTGNSGCGKTTVCRLINGLIPHYFDGVKSGEVLLNGKDISTQAIYETSQTVGSVFQNPRSQFFNVDTNSELAFFAENLGKDAKQIKNDIQTVSEKLNFSSLLEKSMFKISGGEKQKIACGTIAVAGSSVIVLDEPSSNLDTDAIEDFKKNLEQWKTEGKTVIIAEHRLYFLKDLADKVLVFENGEIKKQIDGKDFKNFSDEESKDLGLRAVNYSVNYPIAEKIDENNAIKLENFKYTYPQSNFGIDIENLILPKNKIIAIVGHNGQGKSTFAKTFCGLNQQLRRKTSKLLFLIGGCSRLQYPLLRRKRRGIEDLRTNKKSCGFVCFNNKKIATSKMLDYCYMIMQDVNHQLFTESVKEEVLLSIKENLEEEEKEKIATNALQMLDIEQFANMHPMALSGGQKQRVAIASPLQVIKNLGHF